jgi:hypothetical protein
MDSKARNSSITRLLSGCRAPADHPYPVLAYSRYNLTFCGTLSQYSMLVSNSTLPHDQTADPTLGCLSASFNSHLPAG